MERLSLWPPRAAKQMREASTARTDRLVSRIDGLTEKIQKSGLPGLGKLHERRVEKEKAEFNDGLDPRVADVAKWFIRNDTNFSLLKAGYAAESGSLLMDELDRDLSMYQRRYELTDEQISQAGDVALDERFDTSREWYKAANELMEERNQ